MLVIDYLENLLELCLEAAPWLVLGLIIGGLIKSLIPTSFLERHLSGNGFITVVKAALFGAPLPLCSCGVIPAALGLRRAGASKSATISFLVSTPETGIDSVAISYALLGPFMAIVRPIAAIVSAITAGLLVGRSGNDEKILVSDESEISCCSSVDKSEEQSCSEDERSHGHNHEDHHEHLQNNAKIRFFRSAWDGVVYSFTDLFDKVFIWLIIGLLFAAAVKTFVPVTFLAEWGSGLPAMLVMLLVGIPMYVCATASTPMAAGLLLAGISPGTAMVFLMVGPASNISTLGVIGKELGRRSLIAYIIGVSVIALLTGFIVDYLVSEMGVNVQAQIEQGNQIVPPVIAWFALILLIVVFIKLKMNVWANRSLSSTL